MRFIREHLSEPFGVERLLAQGNLCRRRLENRFREAMGRSPYVFINEQRVEQARRLLAEPQDRSLADIARACGFSEPRRFRLVFKRMAGVNPSRFRQTALRQRG